MGFPESEKLRNIPLVTTPVRDNLIKRLQFAQDSFVQAVSNAVQGENCTELQRRRPSRGRCEQVQHVPHGAPQSLQCGAMWRTYSVAPVARSLEPQIGRTYGGTAA